MDKEMKNGEKLHNVAVFIDYENIYKALLLEYKNVLRLGFFEKLRMWCKERNQRIVKIVAYCNFDNSDLYESYHQSKLQEYGVETVHTSNRGKSYSDLQMTIDVLNTMYTNDNIDEFIIASNDKDMTPLINTIKANKRWVTLITATDAYDPMMKNMPDEIYNVSEICKRYEKIELINDMYKNILFNNLNNFCARKVEEYRYNKEYKHSEIEYTINTYMMKYKLMRYEVINMIADYIKEGKIFVYDYIKSGKDYRAFTTAEAKDQAILKGIIKPEMILHDFNADQFVKEAYDRAIYK